LQTKRERQRAHQQQPHGHQQQPRLRPLQSHYPTDRQLVAHLLSPLFLPKRANDKPATPSCPSSCSICSVFGLPLPGRWPRRVLDGLCAVIRGSYVLSGGAGSRGLARDSGAGSHLVEADTATSGGAGGGAGGGVGDVCAALGYFTEGRFHLCLTLLVRDTSWTFARCL
jgi:hypothetical protein